MASKKSSPSNQRSENKKVVQRPKEKLKEKDEDPDEKKEFPKSEKKTNKVTPGMVMVVKVPVGMAALPQPVPISKGIYSDDELKYLVQAIKAGRLWQFNGILEKPVNDNKIQADGAGLAAAVIDTGVYRHHDLKEAIIKDYNCTGKPNRKSDFQGHGTHIAGIIAGRNGIASKAKIVSLKVTHFASSESTWGNIAQALSVVLNYNEEIDHHNRKGTKISVVNLSFNGFDNLKSTDERKIKDHVVYKLIEKLHCRHIPVVVSGGNYFDYVVADTKVTDKHGLAYPAICRYVIAAGAVFGKDKSLFKKDELAPFTQRLQENTAKNAPAFVLAPAVETVSTGIEGPESYTRMTGSSQAAPVVTGIILLLQQLYLKKNGTLPTVEFLKSCLINGSRKITNSTSAGRWPASAQPMIGNYFDGMSYKVVDAQHILAMV